jgi:biopolymer transport protein ExbD
VAEGQESVRKATLKDVRSIIRRKLKRQPPHEENFLNIYPMMDMMTILLVFLIMQFANSSASIVQSEELQIPYSTSEVEPEDAIPIQISRNEITVDGVRVLSIREGQVDPSQKQGGGTGFLITPLLNTMQQHRDRLKLIAQQNTGRPFKGEVSIIADRRTPFRTLAEVIYTLGQSEFKRMRFVVLKQEGGG